MKTTVRENYFKWIFQQLSDIQDVSDEDVVSFQMEYDQNIYTNLPELLVCTHAQTTKFPFQNFEIDYDDGTALVSSGSSTSTTTVSGDSLSTGDADDDSYQLANTNDSDGSINSSRTTRQPNQTGSPGNDNTCILGKGFFLVKKSENKVRYDELGIQQRDCIRNTIEQVKDQHSDVLANLTQTILNIREVKKTLSESDTKYKKALADAKRKLRLFKDPLEMRMVEQGIPPARKKYRRSLDNKTRYSDSKVTYFAQACAEMKCAEEKGSRKSWEALYKDIWNQHILPPEQPQPLLPLDVIEEVVSNMEVDVRQLLKDGMGLMAEV